jgi:low molecular weight protein-tyrosine phosphatase
MSVNVLFVCLGNICRSPTAHGVFQQLVVKNRLSDQVAVDSAGTGDWHIGHSPDKRATQKAAERGYDLSPLRARLVTQDDFNRYDYVLAMDYSNLNDLNVMCPSGYQGELKLFLPYGRLDEEEVPDPYYGEDGGFDHVLDLVEQASQGLLDYMIKKHQL